MAIDLRNTTGTSLIFASNFSNHRQFGEFAKNSDTNDQAANSFLWNCLLKCFWRNAEENQRAGFNHRKRYLCEILNANTWDGNPRSLVCENKRLCSKPAFLSNFAARFCWAICYPAARLQKKKEAFWVLLSRQCLSGYRALNDTSDEITLKCFVFSRKRCPCSAVIHIGQNGATHPGPLGAVGAKFESQLGGPRAKQ